jgi:transcriptional regulator with PAS, ATPase and Fis domain
VNVRFIAATNKNLEMLVEEGKFREDLYYRLNAGMFYIPPLQERKEDIPLLIEYFIADFQGDTPHESLEMSPEAMVLLLDYHWPGNVRELKNSVNYACTSASQGVITAEDLPAPLRNKHRPVNHTSIRQSEKEIIRDVLLDVNFNKRKAASILGMSRTTLYAKIKQYHIAINRVK